MEVDLQLDVLMPRVNHVVGCSLSVCLNSNVMSSSSFELKEETLAHGCGLRYQVVALGLNDDEEVDVSVNWLGGGSVEVPVEDEQVHFAQKVVETLNST